jgi:hypothetical protein
MSLAEQSSRRPSPSGIGGPAGRRGSSLCIAFSQVSAPGRVPRSGQSDRQRSVGGLGPVRASLGRAFSAMEYNGQALRRRVGAWAELRGAGHAEDERESGMLVQVPRVLAPASAHDT